MIDEVLAQYRIEAELGRGGMGVVYRAFDTRLHRRVALKVLPPDSSRDEASHKSQLHEARMASALSHPHIAALYEVGESAGRFFLAMELVAGKSLASMIRTGDLLPESVARYGAQIADALSHAHEQGIVHRDLKPANVIVTPDGRAKVLDFGIALRLQRHEIEGTTVSRSAFAADARIAGTLPYMAPEHLRGQAADARTDVWALGVTLYEMVSGQLPFRGRTGFEISSAILREAPAPLPEHVPSAMKTVIERCLAKEPGRRYQHAGEVRAALETLGPVPTSSTTGPETLVPVRPHASRWWIATGAAVLVVALGTVATLMRRDAPASAGTSEIRSLAVLPLENLSHEPAQEYFADGMTEALITELCKIGSLRVISRTSAMRYKGTREPLPDVARRLGVDAFVQGSVLREGDLVRVSVQLIHGPSDRHVWAQSFDRELRGILALHSEVAKAIAAEIRVKLTPQEQTRLAPARSVKPEAYEHYVLGRHNWNERKIESHWQAVTNFRKALELDPDYAPAQAALAQVYMLLGEQGGLARDEAKELAGAAMRRAVDLDAGVAEVSTALGVWKLHHEWDWDGSERAFKEAIELNPGLASAHQFYGRSLGFARRFEEARRELRRAQELDPLSSVIGAYLGQIEIFAGRYDQAIGELTQALDLDARHPLVLHCLGEACLAQGRVAEAVTWLERSLETSEEPSSHFIAMLACAYARGHRRPEAMERLSQLQQLSERGRVSSFDMAAVHAALGDRTRAMSWLEDGLARKDPWMVEVDAWPWFESFRAEPAYRELLRRIGLPAGSR